MQRVERNHGRLEARCLIRFDVSAEAVGFPGVEQAARLTRFVDRKDAKGEEIETEWLISSRPLRALNAEQMLAADREYWGQSAITEAFFRMTFRCLSTLHCWRARFKKILPVVT